MRALAKSASQHRPPARAADAIPMPVEPLLPRSGARFTHYSLPAGMILAAPDSLSPMDRQRLNLLLQAAQQIFSGSTPGFIPLDHRSTGENPSDPEDGKDMAR
jgi:hypothetical protein